jgi:hypothetical protein
MTRVPLNSSDNVALLARTFASRNIRALGCSGKRVWVTLITRQLSEPI